MSILFCKNITKVYKTEEKEFKALNQVNIVFPNSGFVGIIGKSGSGKSTLLNCLFGIEKPTSGTINYLGKNIVKFNDKQFSSFHRNDVSIIYQHYNLINDLTVEENVLLPLKMCRSKNACDVNNLLEKYGLINFKDSLCSKLSGGEKQRVAICRALITNPRIVLCDEPTGALDEKNSVMVFETLKEISKTKLIIVVSHNEDLIGKYADRLITMKDGAVVDDTKTEIDNDIKIEEKDTKYSNKISSYFSKLLFKRNKGKTILSLTSSFLGFLSLFLSVGFYNGAKMSEKNSVMDCLSVGYSTVSETTFIEIENSPLMFQKSIKPSSELIDENLNEINSYVVKPNYSSLFSNYPLGKVNNKIVQNFQMIPVIKGIQSFDAIVNKKFIEASGQDISIGDTLLINGEARVSFQTNDKENPIIYDAFSYSYLFKIVSIVDEFSFLNTAKVYYSYQTIENEIQQNILENVLIQTGKRITFYDILCSSDNDDSIGSYSDFLFVTDKNEIGLFFEKIGYLKTTKSKLQIESEDYSISESYSSFISSFSSALIAFVVIAFLGINLVIGIISFSIFIANKKDSAILTCLGARNYSIKSIYLFYSFIGITLCFIASIPVSLIIEKVLNNALYSVFTIKNLVSIPYNSFFGIPALLPLIVFFVSTLISGIFVLTPINFYRNFSIADELRDE